MVDRWAWLTWTEWESNSREQLVGRTVNAHEFLQCPFFLIALALWLLGKPFNSFVPSLKPSFVFDFVGVLITSFPSGRSHLAQSSINSEGSSISPRTSSDIYLG
ncbi:hypothetical protein CC80DRAFT_253980 [Byssothecium circinans]|uniref:Uncharacterized protein n=1 Tax=Byssothecium circinans TaxID=147558 RepID=A0A6A5TAG8_9PLEO|nr:hypothetical protein CC80DRAFT_253980 [Byssothecium circinans]